MLTLTQNIACHLKRGSVCSQSLLVHVWPVNATHGRPPTQCIQEVNYLTTKWQPSAQSMPDEATNHHQYTMSSRVCT